MRSLTSLLGGPDAEQEWDDEVFETLAAKRADQVIGVRILHFVLLGLNCLLLLLGFLGLWTLAERSFFLAFGLLSLLQLSSAVAAHLGFRWRQRLLLMIAAAGNLLWLTAATDAVLAFALASRGATRAAFARDTVFQVLVTVSGISSLILAGLHVQLFLTLVIHKDPAFFACCSSRPADASASTEEVSTTVTSNENGNANAAPASIGSKAAKGKSSSRRKGSPTNARRSKQ